MLYLVISLFMEKCVGPISSPHPTITFFAMWLWTPLFEAAPSPWLKLAHMTCFNQRNSDREDESRSPKCAHDMGLAACSLGRCQDGASLDNGCLLIWLHTHTWAKSKLQPETMLWPNSLKQKPDGAPANLQIHERAWMAIPIPFSHWCLGWLLIRKPD